MVHSHSPTVVPFSVTQVPLRPVIAVASFLSPAAPVFEIRATAGMTNLLVENAARGKALAEALGPHPVALLRGHGNVVVGPNLRRTVSRAIYTEINARLLWQATTLGGPITFIAPEEAAQMESGRDASRERPWPEPHLGHVEAGGAEPLRGRQAMSKAVFYQSIGPELFRHDIDAEAATLTRREAVDHARRQRAIRLAASVEALSLCGVEQRRAGHHPRHQACRDRVPHRSGERRADAARRRPQRCRRGRCIAASTARAGTC